MEKSIESTLDNFLSNDVDRENLLNEKPITDKKKFIGKDFTIIERLDPILVTEDGRQLLREQY